MDNIELFMITVKEYKRITQNKQFILYKFDESEITYAQVQIRLILLRKYISKPENVYIGSILKTLSEKQLKTDELNNLIKKFEKINSSQIKHKISDGTELTLYESIEDVMYGLHLHADQARIRRLQLTHERFPIILTYEFVKEVEMLLLAIHDFIKNNGLYLDKRVEITKSPIISYEQIDVNIKGIKKSPYWSNIKGNDIPENQLIDNLKSIPKEDRNIYLRASLFLCLLTLKPLNKQLLRKLVYFSTYNDWGNFEEASLFINGIPNIGLSNVVRYTKNMKEAYVLLLPNVVNGFSVNSKHLLTNVYPIRFRKSPFSNNYKIISIGGETPEILITKERDV